MRSTVFPGYTARSLRSCKEGTTTELSSKPEQRNPNGRECSEPEGWSAVSNAIKGPKNTRKVKVLLIILIIANLQKVSIKFVCI